MPGVRFPVVGGIKKFLSWHFGRAVKAAACVGFYPRGFESRRCRDHIKFFCQCSISAENTAYDLLQWYQWLTLQRKIDIKHIKRMYTIRSISYVPVAQWIRRETTNLKIAGSNPVGDNDKIFLHRIHMATTNTWFYGVIGYHSGLWIQQSGFKSR